jgi:hypothetical protein
MQSRLTIDKLMVEFGDDVIEILAEFGDDVIEILLQLE